jgi:hypothetical protein
MSFEPEELWGLHLRREGPAHTAEDGVVMEGIYFLCLGRCTMVLPENHIPLRISRGADSHRQSLRINGYQRACRRESHTSHSSSITSSTHLLHGRTHVFRSLIPGAPRKFGVGPFFDIPAGDSQSRTFLREQSCSCAPRAHVDAQEERSAATT